ncbi:hypothetical protein FRB99_000610 [Tulasnella sp. 403]|nr:hypothetical protein FRB99_000610 [Tulasnella sp. 403]
MRFDATFVALLVALPAFAAPLATSGYNQNLAKRGFLIALGEDLTGPLEQTLGDVKVIINKLVPETGAAATKVSELSSKEQTLFRNAQKWYLNTKEAPTEGLAKDIYEAFKKAEKAKSSL